jgi:hypothetical protein
LAQIDHSSGGSGRSSGGSRRSSGGSGRSSGGSRHSLRLDRRDERAAALGLRSDLPGLRRAKGNEGGDGESPRPSRQSQRRAPLSERLARRSSGGGAQTARVDRGCARGPRGRSRGARHIERLARRSLRLARPSSLRGPPTDLPTPAGRLLALGERWLSQARPAPPPRSVAVLRWPRHGAGRRVDDWSAGRPGLRVGRACRYGTRHASSIGGGVRAEPRGAPCLFRNSSKRITRSSFR